MKNFILAWKGIVLRGQTAIFAKGVIVRRYRQISISTRGVPHETIEKEVELLFCGVLPLATILVLLHD